MHFNFSRGVLALLALASSISATIHRPSRNRGCVADQNNAIEWDTAGFSGPVNLHLCPGGAKDISQSIAIIARSVSNSGSYNWRPSRNIRHHKSFVIIIVDSMRHSVYSEDFNISGVGANPGHGLNGTVTSKLHTVYVPTHVAPTHVAPTDMAPTHIETIATSMMEHPGLTVVETQAAYHGGDITSTLTNIIVEVHGTAVQPDLTTFVPEISTFTGGVVGTAPTNAIATEAAGPFSIPGNQTTNIAAAGTNTRVNSPSFTAGADSLNSKTAYGIVGAAAIVFVMGML